LNGGALARLLEPLALRLRLIVARAVIDLVDDAPAMQALQVSLMGDEVRDRVERMQQYGFTSVPFGEAEAIVLAVGGNRNHLVAIATDDRRYRKKGLQPGESALYTDEGDYVILKRGRIVEVKAGTKLRVDAPLAELTGDLTVAGTLHVTGDITGQANVTAAGNVADQGGAKTMVGMRTVYNAHFHNDPQGGVTGVPTVPM